MTVDILTAKVMVLPGFLLPVSRNTTVCDVPHGSRTGGNPAPWARPWAVGAVLAVVEAVLLWRAGMAIAPAVWLTAPGVPGATHDLVVAMALPLAAARVVPLWLGMLVARTAVLVAAGRSVADGLTWRRAAGLVLVPQVAGLLPAMMVVAGGLTAVPYLLIGAAVVVVVLVTATATVIGHRSTAGALATLGALAGLGAMADALPPLPGLAPVGMAGALGLRATVAVAAGAATRPRVAATRTGLTRAGVALVVLVLLGGVTYRVVDGPVSPSSTVAVPLPPVSTAPDGRGVVVLVDGFNSHFRARPVLPVEAAVWGFSYRGLDTQRRLVPHDPADTLDGVGGAVAPLAAQVRELRASYGGPVTLVGISQGALVVRTAAVSGVLDGEVDRLVLVDLPQQVGYLRQVTPDRGQRSLTGLALHATAALAELVTPLAVRADAMLPLEMQPCVLPGSAAPTPIPEVRLRSTTDAVAHRVPAPAGVVVVDHPGAHALTALHPGGRATIAAAVEGRSAGGPPAWRHAATVLHHLFAPWRLPAHAPDCWAGPPEQPPEDPGAQVDPGGPA